MTRTMTNFKEGPVRPMMANPVSPSFISIFLLRKTVLMGLFLLLLVLVPAIFAPWITSHSPDALAVAMRLNPPGSEFLFGSDDFGRDVFTRVLYGARTSLWVGGCVVLFAVGIGSLAGLFSGFYHGIDLVLSRIFDGLMAFPGLVLAIAMAGVIGNGAFTVIFALGIVYMPRVARVVRSSVLVVRELSYIEACIALGAKKTYILMRHILPNCLSPIIIQASFIFSYAVLGEAALSFLGVGIPPTTPSWGNMLAEARTYIVSNWWMAVFPGLTIMITVLGLNLCGDGLRDALDPKLRRN